MGMIKHKQYIERINRQAELDIQVGSGTIVNFYKESAEVIETEQ